MGGEGQFCCRYESAVDPSSGQGCCEIPSDHESQEIKLSVAFTKEESAETASETFLPDRPVSTEPNLVTAMGLIALEGQLSAARQAYAAANTVEDVNERRRQAAGRLGDMRYFAERVRTARLVPEPRTTGIVAFGSTVTLSPVKGRVLQYRIVGEDEADPSAGTISYISPLAKAVVGREVGENVTVAGRDLEIVDIA